jgi:hypothetical protein
MNDGPDALGTAQNGCKSAKYENLNPVASVLSKTSPRAQHLKTRPDTVENMSGSAKHENWTRLTRYSRKRVRERKK